MNNTKKSNSDKYFQFINYVREHADSLCKKCWGTFVKDLLLVNYYNDTGSWRSYYYLYPNKDADWQTRNNFIGNDLPLPERNYSVFYNFRNQFIALTFYDIMMFDFDFKDFKEEPPMIKALIDEYLGRLVNAAKKYDINLAFMPFDTDRGYHVFLISDNVDFRSLYWMDLMAAMCNDSWYVAFSFTNGFAIRLNQKKDSPDDFIAETYNAKRSTPRLAFESLVDAITRCMDAGQAPSDSDPTQLGTLLWSAEHGLVSLRVSRPNFPWPPLDELVDEAVRRIVLGQQEPAIVVETKRSSPRS